MKTYDLLELPSCEGVAHHWQADSLAYRIARYVLCSQGGCPWSVSPLNRMRLIREVIATNGKPFFASDLFGECPELGGWMNGLDLAWVIRATGKTREHFIPVGDLYKRCEIKEWELAHSPGRLQQAYDEVKMYIVDRL